MLDLVGSSNKEKTKNRKGPEPRSPPKKSNTYDVFDVKRDSKFAYQKESQISSSDGSSQ